MIRRQHKKRFAFAAILLLLGAFEIGILHARTFTPVGATNGLEARVVPAMLIDRDGYLWIGSREGLFRYDGYETTAFIPDPGDTGAITDLDIRALAESSDGDIWIGTNAGGLNRFDRRTGRFEAFRSDSTEPGTIPDDSVYGVSEGPAGGIWAATVKGVSRLDRATGKFEHFPHDANDPATLSHEWAYRAYLAPSNTLWVSTVGGGINRWNPEPGDFSRYDMAGLTGGSEQLNDVFAMQEDADGFLWVGTRNGLVRFDPGSETASLVDIGAVDGNVSIITDMIAGPSGRLWLATMSRGVIVVDPATGDWAPVSNRSQGAEDDSDVHSLMSLVASNRLLFIGTWGSGVYRAPLEEDTFTLLGNTLVALANDNISAVLPTPVPGRPWVGSFGGGPQRVNLAERAVETASADPPLGITGVLDLAYASGGRLFAATTHGLFEVGEDGSQLAHYQHDPEKEKGLGPGYVGALLASGADGLWIGMSTDGLRYLNLDTGAFESFRHHKDRPDSLSGNGITALLDDREGYLWVGTRSNGLNRCRIEIFSCERFTSRKDNASTLSNYHVTALYRDRRGRVWVGTDGGLNLIERNETGQVTGFRQWRTRDGLLSDSIMAIEEDLDESLWLSTRHGLSRLNPATGSVVNHVAESGLPTSHFNAKASAADDRFIYFGSVDGLLAIEKGSLLTTRSPSAVNITSLESMSRGGSGRMPHALDGRLRIPYGDIVALEMAVLDYSEGAHDYWYRLSADGPWNELGTQRQIIFHGLAPGVYSFQARGRNVYGQVGESRALELEIVPPIWMRTWFRSLAAVLLLALGIGIHMVRQQNLRRRANELLRLGEVRERALEEQLGDQSELAVLTPRQKEILQLIAEGYSTREIADLLELSIKTIESHRANIMERLEIRDVPGLVRLAIRSRLVSPHD